MSARHENGCAVPKSGGPAGQFPGEFRRGTFGHDDPGCTQVLETPNETAVNAAYVLRGFLCGIDADDNAIVERLVTNMRRNRVVQQMIGGMKPVGQGSIYQHQHDADKAEYDQPVPAFFLPVQCSALYITRGVSKMTRLFSEIGLAVLERWAPARLFMKSGLAAVL